MSRETRGRAMGEWDSDDTNNPRNWSTARKIWATYLLSMLALAASMGSSITAPAEQQISTFMGIETEVGTLSTSLYVLGFGFGPLCWAPVSELWGRRWGLLPAMLCLALLSVGTARSTTAAALFLTRFFAGVFGSAPVSNVAAALGDFWDPSVRGNAVMFYSVAVVGGPTLGPVIGAALVADPGLGWRWTEYAEACFVLAVFLLCVVALPESYGPVLLRRRDRKLQDQPDVEGANARCDTGDPVKTKGDVSFSGVLSKHFRRPLVMLATEPMVASIACYASFVYGILYMTLEVFPIIFQEIHGMSPVLASLPFLGLLFGVLLASFVTMANQPRYKRLSAAAGGKPVPEARMLPVAATGFVFAAGLFWLGWTAGPASASIWSPIVAAAAIGLGFNVIFNQCVNTLVDTYGIYAASAVSANTFLRSMMAAGLPLAAKPMFHGLGVGPAMSVIGGIATALICVPFLFIRYGAGMRENSKFATR